MSTLKVDTVQASTTNGSITLKGNGTGSVLIPSEIAYSANVTGNLSVTRSLAVGYTDGRVPQANLEVKGNAHITGATTIAGALTLGTDLAVAQGGTGASSLTDGGVLLGSGTSAITAMGVLSDGQMIVGDGSTDPVAESGATLRTSIGVGTGDSPQFTAVNIGAATDTTVARASAGDINVEGNIIYRAGGTDVPVADGGTGASSLTDGGVLLGSGTSAITAMGVLTDGQMIVGDGSTDPVAESGDTLRNSIGVGSTASGTIMQIASANTSGNVRIARNLAVGYANLKRPGANLDVLGNAYISGETTIGDDTFIDGALTLATDLAVAQGGTGASTLGDGYVLLGSGTNAITALNVTAKGSILAGDGSGDPVALAVGSNDLVLTADSGEASGLKWAAASDEVSAGDVLVFYSANTTGNVSLGRGLAVGYVGEKIPGANLDVNGNAFISGATTIAGALEISDGSVSSPALTNIADTNTGIYFPKADNVAISVGGREAIQFGGKARGGLVDSNIRISSNVVNHQGLSTTNYTEYANNIVNAGSSFTVSTGTNVSRYTLDQSSCEITLPAGQPIQPASMKTIVLYLKQDGTGGRTVNFNAPGGEALEWNNSASEPEVVSGANKVSIYTFMKFHGDTNWYCSQSFIEN